MQVQLTWHNKREASLLWLLSHAKKRDGKLQIYYIWCFLLLKTIWVQKSRKDPANRRTSSMSFKANTHFQTHGTSRRLLKCQHAGRMAGRHLFISDNTLKEMAFHCGRYCPFLCCSFKGGGEWMNAKDFRGGVLSLTASCGCIILQRPFSLSLTLISTCLCAVLKCLDSFPSRNTCAFQQF